MIRPDNVAAENVEAIVRLTIPEVRKLENILKKRIRYQETRNRDNDRDLEFMYGIADKLERVRLGF